MPSLEGSNLCPLWRFRDAIKKQKVTRGDCLQKKMLIYDERSRNLYENKQNHDKMPDEMSDIYVEMTRILQRIAGWEGQFAVNRVCGARSVRELTANLGLRQASMQETPHPLRTSAPSPLGEGWKLISPLRGERVAAMRRRVRGHFASDKPLGCGSASLRCTVKHSIVQSINWGSTHDSTGKSPNR